MATDKELIAAINGAVWIGDYLHRSVNSRRGLTKTAQRNIERSLRRHLRTVLGRNPTPEEVDLAWTDDPWDP